MRAKRATVSGQKVTLLPAAEYHRLERLALRQLAKSARFTAVMVATGYEPLTFRALAAAARMPCNCDNGSRDGHKKKFKLCDDTTPHPCPWCSARKVLTGTVKKES